MNNKYKLIIVPFSLILSLLHLSGCKAIKVDDLEDKALESYAWYSSQEDDLYVQASLVRINPSFTLLKGDSGSYLWWSVENKKLYSKKEFKSLLETKYRDRLPPNISGGVYLYVADNVEVGVMLETLRLLRENNLRYIILCDIIEGVMTEFMEKIEQQNIKRRKEVDSENP